jgi:hypothetical protein
MARRPLNELCPSTVSNYRSLLRKLWLKSIVGSASEGDLLEIAELERVLCVKASEIRGPGRPPKYGTRTT